MGCRATRKGAGGSGAGGMRDKVLILGASGLLGRAMLRHVPAGTEAQSPKHHELPLEDPDALIRRVDQDGVRQVLLLAAWTQVDACEDDPARAFHMNGILPGRIGARLAARKIPLLFVSTDYVFDGCATSPYREHDPKNPLSVYGKSKWDGECALRDSGVDLQVARVSGLYGRGGPDFVSTMVRLLAKGTVRVVNDQHVAPTWVDHLAPALWTIALSEERGVFHVPMQGETTWFAFARALAQALGYPSDRVLPTTTAEFGRPAPRPAYAILNGQRLHDVFGLTLPSWEAGLAQRVEEIRQEGASVEEGRS